MFCHFRHFNSQGAFMGFNVKEIFFSLQGEGVHAGRAALFCRFSGCNLWTGHEADRTTAKCTFCDTDFIGADGGYFPDEEGLVRALLESLPSSSKQSSPNKPIIILTGGEPALQITQKLIDLLHEHTLYIAIETNGSLPLPQGIDWVCVSPKAGVALHVTSGDELKLVWPQDGISPETYLDLDFTHFVLQPCDNLQSAENIAITTAYCLSHPIWRLGLQIHKILGII